MHKIIDRFFSGNNFIGYLCAVEHADGLVFGYDADCVDPEYAVYHFEDMEEFTEFLNDKYGPQGWR